MARAGAGKVNGMSRVRFVMMEAEIADGGDLGQFTQAMQNALRGPAPVVVKRIAAPAAQTNGAEHAEPEVLDETSAEEVDAAEVTSAAPKAKAQRKPAPKPDVIELDTTSEPPLSSLADPGNSVVA